MEAVWRYISSYWAPSNSQLPANSFLGGGVDLNYMVTTELQPTEAFNTKCNLAIDTLATFLKTNSKPYSIAEVIKGGSLGKGTAIRENCDLDMILVFNGCSSVESYKNALPGILRHLDRIVRGYGGNGHSVRVVRTTGKHVEIEITFPGIPFTLSADLVPSMSKRDLADVMADMRRRSVEDRKHFSSMSVMELSAINFVKLQPANVKNLIRLVKHWKKTHVTAYDGMPTSYPLELLTISLWESAGSPPRFNIEQGFKNILQNLVQYTSIHIRWMRNYIISDIAGPVSGKPYILHPYNPFDNVAARFEWRELAQMAQLSADSPALRIISVQQSWR